MSATEIGDARVEDARARIAAKDEARRRAAREGCTNLEAEQAVLGSMLLDPEAAQVIARMLTPSDFSALHLSRTFAAIVDVLEQRSVPDIVAVGHELRQAGTLAAMGDGFLSRLLEQVPSAANALAYARIVRSTAAQRRIMDAADALRACENPDDIPALCARMAERAEALQVAQRSESAKESEPLDAVDAVALPDPPEQPMLVDYLIARPATVIVFGPAQSGKSWIIMNACMDLIGGGGAFGGADHMQIRPLVSKFGGAPDVVLWVYGSEDTPARVRSRMRTCWANGPHWEKEMPRGRFFVVTPPVGMSLAAPEGLRWLSDQADKVAATVVVLDTLFSLCGSTLDMADNKQVMPFMIGMQALRNSGGGRCVLMVHHPRKAPSEKSAQSVSKADTIMGAGAWRAQVDAMILLEAQDGETGGVVRLQSVKAKDVPTPTGKLRLTLDKETGRFRELEETEEPDTVAQAAQTRVGRPRQDRAGIIIDALRQGRRVTVAGAEVLELLDCSPKTWKNVKTGVLSELLKRDVCVVNGEFKITSGGVS